jgi:cytochrome c-type protein NapC
MIRFDLLVGAFLIVAAALALVAVRGAGLPQTRAGKILTFIALFVFPALALGAGFSTHIERAQSTAFCLSCHIMADHGRSLWAEDPSYLAAAHFQNNRVPRERACYTCHTDYAMFGGVRSKIRGLRHLYVHYLGSEPKPTEIRLYEPYNNRECLHCHDGGRKFMERSAHNKTDDQMARIRSNQLSCTSSRCHDTVHDVGSLNDAPLWKGAR